ncbi:hypothetical protein HF325_006775 [Metschnikowia pulcherrima]|uniref:Small EDRK-rich factor-like N-terminal domain-containing protein n=1 Tax=Metschnikowia pulcherrima TaxID=27326 RepID=A0A8H7GPA8_9ASCO|nr:hypothetical protein HF325_006775 [Metschnikowia pulcherrima]
MARGNQRDLARAKNQKKQQDIAKAQKKEGDPKKRMESDAEKMRQKQAMVHADKASDHLKKYRIFGLLDQKTLQLRQMAIKKTFSVGLLWLIGSELGSIETRAMEPKDYSKIC